MKVVGIDPGLANTGIVVIEDGRVVFAITLTTKGAGKPDFASVMERGTLIGKQVREELSLMTGITAVAIEGYEDFGGGHLRNRDGKPIPNRWTTPAVCALIGVYVSLAGCEPTWQKASTVMGDYRAYKALWAQGRSIIPGDEKLTNEHLRSAACHALAWIDANKPQVAA
jgi:hypothetical protein